MNAASVKNVVQEVQATGDEILKVLEEAIPSVGAELAAGGAVVDLLAKMAITALTGWSNAAGVPITEESVAALLPNPAPLTEPDAPTA